MIKILTITEHVVGWKDEGEDEIYMYPRCLFPIDLTLESKIEYSAGQFLPVT
jgi:hypothetical protein